MSTESTALERRNLVALQETGLLHDWVEGYPTPEKWPHYEWEGLLNLVEAEGFGPINPAQLGLLVEDIWFNRFGDGAVNKQVAKRIGSAEEIQTVSQLATAGWADDRDFAERWAYQPGDFWMGRCPKTGVPLGFYDETHVLTNAGTRAGKGTTLIVPNHLLWLGSLVSIDPKGENASLTAARRGDGNDVCIGMGQKVRVLDPMGIATVEDKYRAHFNPIDALDLDDPRFIEKASSMADAMVIRTERETDNIWNDKARTLIKGLVLHVKTAPDFSEEQRTLNTVYDLATMGDERAADDFYRRATNEYAVERSRWEAACAATPDGQAKPAEPKHPIRPNPFDVLFRLMKENKAVRTIAAVGSEMLDLRRNEKGTTWLSFHTSLTQHLEFLESPGLQKVMSKSDFKLSELKEDSDGASWFLCLSLDDMVTYNRWLRLMITLISYECRKNHKSPANDHRVLMCLDEFETIGYLKQIDEGLSTLAGYHVKLLIVTQYLQQIKKHYEKSWHGFHENVGLRMFFGVKEETAKELSDWIGETEYVTTNRNQSIAVNEANTATRTQTTSENIGKSVSDTTSTAQSESLAKGTSQTTAEGVTESSADSVSQSTAEGVTHSRAEGTSHSVADGVSQSTAKGVNQSMADGTSTSDAHGTTQSTGENQSNTDGSSQAQTSGGSISDTHGGSVSHGQNQSSNWSVSEGESQSFDGDKDEITIASLLGFDREVTQSGENRGSSQGGSIGTSLTNSRSWSRSQAQNYSNTDTRSSSMTRGVSINRGVSDTTTRGRTHTLTRGSSLTDTQGSSRTVTDGRSTTDTHGTSRTDTRGLSKTETRGTSRTDTRGTSETKTHGVTETKGRTTGETWSKTASLALGQSHTEGRTFTSGMGQNVTKRPLMYPHDITREFAPRRHQGDTGAPGYALVLIDGERPAIVQRTLYYDDVGFDALYDRHPEHPESDPIPLLRDGVIATRITAHPQADQGEMPRLFWALKTEFNEPTGPVLDLWYKSPGEKVVKGEPLYAIKPGVCIAAGFHDEVIIFRAPFSGTLKSTRVRVGQGFDPDEVFADIEFHIEDLWDAIDYPVRDDDFDRFRSGHHPIVTRMQRRMRELIAAKQAAEDLREKERLAEAKRLEEEERQRQEAQHRREQDEKRRRFEEEERAKDEAMQAKIREKLRKEEHVEKEAEERQKAEEQRRRQAEREADAERRAEEKRRRQEEAEARKAEEEKQKREAEEAEELRELIAAKRTPEAEREFKHWGVWWPPILWAGILIPLTAVIIALMPPALDKPVNPGKEPWELDFRDRYNWEDYSDYRRKREADYALRVDAYNNAQAEFADKNPAYEARADHRLTLRWVIALAWIFITACCIGLAFLRYHWLQAAWPHWTHLESPANCDDRDLERTRFFRRDLKFATVYKVLFVITIGVALIGLLMSGPMIGLGLLMGGALYSVGLSFIIQIGQLLVRRIIWMVTVGEVVDFKGKPIPFDPVPDFDH